MGCSKNLPTTCENLSMDFDMAASPVARLLTAYLGYTYEPVSHKVNTEDCWLMSILILACSHWVFEKSF